MQLEPHLMKVYIEGSHGKNEISVIDLKGAYKLLMFAPKAGVFRVRMAEVISSCSLIILTL